MKKFKMTNEVYDILKEVALTILPALSVFIVAIGKIWNIPYTAEVSATVMAIDTLLGACLHVSNKNYNIENGKDMGE
ncbi:MAG: phage holin [Eggerthia catenaformis]|uniref:phage holin n=1 Tax=Eggerthia catenaformis TaxID=31973 RepID=UPI003FA0AE79